MMLRWAEENKTQRKVVDGIAGDYEIPQRNGIDWKKAFKYVTGLDMKLDDGWKGKHNYVTLTKAEMIKCNKYYKEYRC
jgi:Zn/Cd-binding protein ZinT